MTTRMQQRRGTSAEWTAGNPVLAAGEIGINTTLGHFKIGDGSSTWSQLTYFADLQTAIDNLVDNAPGVLNTLNEIAAAIDDDPNFFTTVATNLTNHEADTTAVHGIADTSALATKTYATTAVTNHADLTTTVHGIANTANLATKAYADAAVSTHEADTTSVHGIADTSVLMTQSGTSTAIGTHNSATTAVHGIADTAALATKTYADQAVATHEADTTAVHGIADTSALATKTYADSAVSTHEADTTSVHGITDAANLIYTSDTRLTDTRTPSDASVTVTKIASDAVTTIKILDANVTAAKLASDAVTTIKILDANVTTAKIADANVTTAKIADSAITSAKIADGTIVDTDVNASAAIAQSKISGLTADLAAKAPLASPALTGVPTAPTAAAATNTTQVATTAYVRGEVAALVNSAGATLDTLGEIATALGNDANLSTTLTTSIGLKAPLASPTFTGTVTVAASGVAFTDGTQTKEGVASRTPIVQKTAAYTLSALTERDSLIEVSSATGVTITIPTNTAVAYPVGTSIDILQTGAGQVTIAPVDGTVTVNATPGLKLRTTWSSATLFKRAANTWVVFGDLTA
jgi:hypothetical protein